MNSFYNVSFYRDPVLPSCIGSTSEVFIYRGVQLSLGDRFSIVYCGEEIPQTEKFLSTYTISGILEDDQDNFKLGSDYFLTFAESIDGLLSPRGSTRLLQLYTTIKEGNYLKSWIELSPVKRVLSDKEKQTIDQNIEQIWKGFLSEEEARGFACDIHKAYAILLKLYCSVYPRIQAPNWYLQLALESYWRAKYLLTYLHHYVQSSLIRTGGFSASCGLLRDLELCTWPAPSFESLFFSSTVDDIAEKQFCHYFPTCRERIEALPWLEDFLQICLIDKCPSIQNAFLWLITEFRGNGLKD
jgi:hypothetical protein